MTETMVGIEDWITLFLLLGAFLLFISPVNLICGRLLKRRKSCGAY